MATIPTPTVHSYIEINHGKFAEVKHYELKEVTNGNPILSNLINVSKNRNFARSNPDYWLKIREGKKWINPALTGLFKTSTPLIYYGDHNDKKNLIIVRFSANAEEVIIYYFKDYYTRDLKPLIGATVR
ncbi:hypothetical protein [Gillisia limnaea]|uniref:Uncharacterized protein n=1 Tax=Gillisia limnaea (strain DSM 15749 / LMG 21470 / R-8282) TaxID=865937 RepID=H2BVB9_GILLR|nr:hypothetical protein [Gillisia limnaea]EHQ01784.1 hypothetical protein Gilli_1110 [Gillisia limnaea DSM 15749]